MKKRMKTLVLVIVLVLLAILVASCSFSAGLSGGAGKTIRTTPTESIVGYGSVVNTGESRAARD